MKQIPTFPSFILMFVFLSIAWFGLNLSPARAQEKVLPTAVTNILYDGSLGGTPNSQQFIYQTLPFVNPNATQTFNSGLTTLDTTPARSESAGYVALPAQVPTLDPAQGFRLVFTVRLDSEGHNARDDNGDGLYDRAGFSVILLGNDQEGIELGFWQDEIWAQADDSSDPNDLFTQAEGVLHDTTSSLQTYELTIVDDNYTLALASSGLTLLTGPVRNYTDFGGFPDPYETPNFIFLGDNTSSADSATELSFVSITNELVPLAVHIGPLTGTPSLEAMWVAITAVLCLTFLTYKINKGRKDL